MSKCRLCNNNIITFNAEPVTCGFIIIQKSKKHQDDKFFRIRGLPLKICNYCANGFKHDYIADETVIDPEIYLNHKEIRSDYDAFKKMTDFSVLVHAPFYFYLDDDEPRCIDKAYKSDLAYALYVA